METYWLIGSKSAYTSVIGQDRYDMDDEDHGAPTFNSSNILEGNTARTCNDPVADLSTPSPRKLSTVNGINKRASSIIDQCPFSGRKVEVQPAGI